MRHWIDSGGHAHAFAGFLFDRFADFLGLARKFRPFRGIFFRCVSPGREHPGKACDPGGRPEAEPLVRGQAEALQPVPGVLGRQALLLQVVEGALGGLP
jgi:hypothetical protein